MATNAATIDSALHPPVASAMASNWSKVGVSATSELMTENGPIPISHADSLGHQFKVWTGTEWALGQPKPAHSQKQLVRITLNDGRTFKCSTDLPIILKDGSRTTAGELHVDQELHRSQMPTYPGNPAKSFSASFLAGVVFGYGMVNTPQKTLDDGISFNVPHVVVPQKITQVVPSETDPNEKVEKQIPNPHLETLGYDREAAIEYTRTNNIEFDHKQDALIIVPKGMQRADIMPDAPLADRIQWAAGFVFASNRYSLAMSARANIVAALKMINSTGAKYEITARCMDSLQARWKIERVPFKQDDVEGRASFNPKVWAITKLSGTSAVFTVDGVSSVMVDGVVVGLPPSPAIAAEATLNA